MVILNLYVTSSLPQETELPMTNLDGTQELPNIVPVSQTTAFASEGLTQSSTGVNSGSSSPTGRER